MTEPRVAKLLLRWLTPGSLRAQVEGDLLEGYTLRASRDGPSAARRWYWRQLFSVDVLRLRRLRRPRHRNPRGRGNTMFFHDILQDVKYGLRVLAREPLFALAALATLAIGIGANTAIFTIVNSVLLRPLPYERPDELVMIFRSVPRFGFTRSTASYPDYADWKDQSTTFASIAAYGYTTRNYTDRETAERWRGYQVTGNLFSLLGVSPLLGRVVTETDDSPQAPPVVVLSYALWQSRFGANPDIAGNAVTLDGEPATVIGVMPPEFDFPSRTTQFWFPLRADPDRMERDMNFLIVIGRLRPGSSFDRARVEITSLAARIDAEEPDGNRDYGVFLERRHDFVVRDAQRALWVFMGAVGLVMIVALTNMANLMLARGTTRHREIAVRAALGATRPRLIRQLLAESTLLSLAGGVFGLAVALLTLKMLTVLGAGQLPRLEEVRLDVTAFSFAAGLSFVTGLLFGTLPALIASRSDAQSSLRAGVWEGHIGFGGFGSRLQHGLVIAEIGLAVSLSIGAGLLVNSFSKLTSIEPGFDPHNLVAARVAPPSPDQQSDLSEGEMSSAMQARQQFYTDLLERSGSLPGVTGVALSYAMPFGGYSFGRVIQPEGTSFSEGDEPLATGNVVSGDYFRTMRIPITRGRVFSGSETLDGPSVAVINQTMADMYWSGQDAVGQRFRIGSGDSWTTIVGVVPDVVNRSLAEDPHPAYYRPYTQVTWPDGMFILMRSQTPTSDLVAALRTEVRRLNPTLPVTDVTTASELLSESVASPRFRTAVLGIFGIIAIALAFVGIYGLVSFTVGNRKREIGIRMALGAARGGVLRMVLGRGAVLAVAGVLIGVAGALVLTRFLSAMLFDLTPYDVPTYTTCAVLVVLVCLIAAYGPARKAAATDPLISLRYE